VLTALAGDKEAVASRVIFLYIISLIYVLGTSYSSTFSSVHSVSDFVLFL
jgi:hypothetical protein